MFKSYDRREFISYASFLCHDLHVVRLKSSLVHLDVYYSEVPDQTIYMYSKTCVRQPPLKLSLVVEVKRWLSYKGTCHVILLAKLHDMYLYKTDNFFRINHYLKSVSKVALLHRFYCIFV